MMYIKRILCFFNIHWSGTTDGGLCGDAKKCDICGKNWYGLGWVIFGRNQ